MSHKAIPTLAGVLEVTVNDKGCGQLVSALTRDTCPWCFKPDCCLTCCDSSEEHNRNGQAVEESEFVNRLKYNSILDGIESMVLAHACAGIDITSLAYRHGIETALEAAANALS